MISLCDRYLPQEYFKDRIEKLKDDKNKIKAHVCSRGLALGVGIGTGLLRTVDLVVGLNASLFTVFSGGKIKSATKVSNNHLDSAQNIGSDAFLYLLKILNPKADVDKQNPESQILVSVTEFFKQRIISASAKEGFFQKHIVSRGFALGGMVTSVFVRSIGLLIGAYAGVVAIVLLGKHKQANNLAYLGFRFVGLIKDEVYFATRLLNPGLLQ